MKGVLQMDPATAAELVERLIDQADHLVGCLRASYGRMWSETPIGAEIVSSLLRAATWFHPQGRAVFYAGVLSALPDMDQTTPRLLSRHLPEGLWRELVPLLTESYERTKATGKGWIISLAGLEWAMRFRAAVEVQCGDVDRLDMAYRLGISLVGLHQRHASMTFLVPVLHDRQEETN